MTTALLPLHPATALWWQQRDTCARCHHCRQSPDEGMQCWLKFPPEYCIDARDSAGQCGPEASRYQPRKEL